MNIRHENVPGQVQEVVFEINKEDYAANLEAALKKQRRTAQVPGFRPGNAPMGMIKKMYEKTLMVNEIDQLVNTNMDKFFKDNDIKVIFEPLPIEEKSKIDFENAENFEFAYEYALAPEVKIDYTTLPTVVDFKIIPTDEERTNFINQLRERHGNYVTPETVAENDSLSVKYGEDQDGFCFVRDLTDEAQKEVLGKKKDDTFTLALRKAFKSEITLARFLKKEEKDLEADNDYNYELSIKHIGRIELAEMNEEFFKKAYPDGSITNEEQLTAEANKVITGQYQQELDRQFMNDAIETLIDNVKVELPDDFMKRYILAVQKDMTAEMLDERFNDYKRSFQWQILENSVVEGADVQVKSDDVKDYFRQFFIQNYFGNFNFDDVKERVEELVNQAMTNRENVKAVYDMLYDNKLVALLRSKMTIEIKEGDLKAFVDFVGSRQELPKEEVKEEAQEEPKKTTKRKCAKKEAAPAEETTEEAPKAKKPRAKKSTTKEE